MINLIGDALHFKIVYKNNYVYISNYKSILCIEENKVLIKKDSGTISIVGEDIVANKILNNDLLLVGKIKEIKIDE